MDEQVTIDDAVNIASVLTDVLAHHADHPLSTRPDAVSTDLRRLAAACGTSPTCPAKSLCGMCGIDPVWCSAGRGDRSFLARRAAPGVHEEVLDRRAPIALAEGRAAVTQFTRRRTR
jgi:hypothetical protein